MGQRTPLYEQHLALGAKMVDFGGWDMPLHYGSQVEEHHQVRRDCGVFDVSHMTVVDVTGAQAKAWLQHLLANDVERLKTPGKALYSGMLNERGGVIDDLIVYLTDWGYRVVVNAATRVPATPARTAWKSCCRPSRPPISSPNWSAPVSPRSAWARATPCAWKPA